MPFPFLLLLLPTTPYSTLHSCSQSLFCCPSLAGMIPFPSFLLRCLSVCLSLFLSLVPSRHTRRVLFLVGASSSEAAACRRMFGDFIWPRANACGPFLGDSRFYASSPFDGRFELSRLFLLSPLLLVVVPDISLSPSGFCLTIWPFTLPWVLCGHGPLAHFSASCLSKFPSLFLVLSPLLPIPLSH